MDKKYSYCVGVKCGDVDGIENGRFSANLKDGITITAHSEIELENAVHDHFYATDPDYTSWWDSETAKDLVIEKIAVDRITFGFSSCVGIGNTDYPLSHGNYFSIQVKGKHVGVINFWYENLKEAIDRFDPKSFNLEIFEGGDGVIITSPDIPDDWMIANLFMKYNCGLSKPAKHKIRKLKGLL